MKIIDEKGRLFGKVSIIDLLVLILIVAVALFLVVRQVKKGSGSDNPGNGQPVTVVYRVAVNNVNPDSYNVVQRFVDKAAGSKDQLMTGTQLLDGYVVDCVAAPHVTYTTTADGQVLRVESTGDDPRLDLIFTLEATVTNTVTNAVGSQEVRVGNGQYVKTAHFDFYGSILDAQWSYEQ